MRLKPKLEFQDRGVIASFIFYVLSGIVSLAALILVDFRLIHVGIIGVLNLMTAYGLLKNRIWTIWVVIALFFAASTFSLYTLYYAFRTSLFLDVSMIAYFILTCVFTIYSSSKVKLWKVQS